MSQRPRRRVTRTGNDRLTIHLSRDPVNARAVASAAGRAVARTVAGLAMLRSLRSVRPQDDAGVMAFDGVRRSTGRQK